jgi:hypothetical protein
LEVGSGRGRGQKRTRGNAHHVTFDKVKPERYFLNTLVEAVHTLFGIREDNVRFLVVACQHALLPHPKKRKEKLRQPNEARMNKEAVGNSGGNRVMMKNVRNDYGASVLENEENAAYSLSELS